MKNIDITDIIDKIHLSELCLPQFYSTILCDYIDTQQLFYSATHKTNFVACSHARA